MEVNIGTILFFAAAMYNIYSFNANGLRDNEKSKKVFALLEEWKCDICFLQETHWDDNILNEMEKLWNGKIVASNSNRKQCGVAIIINSKWKDCVRDIDMDQDGRYVSVQFINENEEMNLVNIYMPNVCNEKYEFIRLLKPRLNMNNIILGGDWNIALSSNDRYNTKHICDKAYCEMKTLLSEYRMCDIWRRRNPHAKRYSWKRLIDGLLKMSRIDYFIIHEDFKTYVKNVTYMETSISDHNFVFMQIDFSTIEKGPGVWVLNNLFLLENTYCDKVTKLIEKERQSELYNNNMLLFWDNLKFKIKKISQIYGKFRKKNIDRHYYSIQNKLKRFSEMCDTNKKYAERKYVNLMAELEEIEQEKCQGAILRSKAKWAIDGDKNTKFFLNLEKKRQNNKNITQVKTGNGKVICDTDNILNEICTFYTDLYDCVQTDQTDIDNFLSIADKRIDESDRELCDKNVTIDEVRKSLFSMSKHKSPGADGLTVEFYIQFWDELKDILLRLYQCVYTQSIMTRSMRSGHITLIYKNKGDKNLLKNWRPISLLNVDYKIIARVMSDRLKQVLPGIISPEQSSCIIGRDITDTVASIRDVIWMMERENEEGYLIKIDQEKAFDRVSHQYLFSVLEKFGFGPVFNNWIKIFYQDISSSVKCNGYLTNYFPVKNSVRQGCPISALLFTLTAEPLNIAFKQCKDITPIAIPFSTKQSIIFQHADDTTVTVSDKKSIFRTFEMFDEYGKASGAKINKSKTEIMCLGKSIITEIDTELQSFSISKDVIQILGVYVGKKQTECDEQNWKRKIDHIKSLLNMWKQRHLSIQGRAIVIGSLTLSRMWYILQSQSIPDWALQAIKTEILRFMWMNKSHPVRYSTMIGKKKEGGMNIPDITLKMNAFRIKFIKRFLDNTRNDLWKETMKYFMKSICNMNLTFECFYMKFNKQMLKELPCFYQEMFMAWNTFYENVEFNLGISDIYNQPLFHNYKICFRNQPIYFKFFIEAGFVKIKDICYEVVPGFIRLNLVKETIMNICDNVSEKRIELAYAVIRKSIPLEWDILLRRQVNTSTNTLSVDCVVISGTKQYPLLYMSTSNIYDVLRQRVFFEPISQNFWTNKFPNCQIEKCWEIIHLNGKLPDMVENDFRITHNIIYTLERLHKMKIVDDELCIFCRTETEDVIHLFLKCNRLKRFKQVLVYHVENILKSLPNNQINCINFDEILMLGYTRKHRNVNTFFLNFFLSIARLCILKTRNVKIQHDVDINIEMFFKYNMKKYISYLYAYYEKIEDIQSFRNKFTANNALITHENNTIRYEW